MPKSTLHEPSVPRRERARRATRLASPKTWRALLLGVTDPANDQHWDFIRKDGSPAYMENPEPWLAPGVLDQISDRLPAGARLLEWGAGASTLWFASQGIDVVSYETDAGWAAEVRRRAGGKADVRHMPPGDEYASADLTGFDGILIDGRERNRCGLHVAEAGAAGQLVIFDDSHRPAYRQAMEAISARATWQAHFPGLNAVMTPKMTSLMLL